MTDVQPQAAGVPEGFAPHFRKSPLTDPWEPLYSRITGDAVVLGVLTSEGHCNSRGLVHGGLISALADNAMGLSCVHAHKQAGKEVLGAVTVTLHVDFLRPVKQGQWLEFVTTAIKTGRQMDMAQGMVTADGRDCAFVSATFSVVPA
ncbi:MAG: PaaI family thioesterase [Candidatus Phaeomarinobacter sp.]